MGFFDNAIMWVIGILVVTTIAISAVLPGVLTAIAGVQVQGTATGELWTGTAATAHAMAFAPIVATTDFRKAASYSQYNDTKINVGNATPTSNHISILIDANAAHSSATWDNLSVVFTLQGANATNNVTWVLGTCNAANKTWVTSPQTYTDIDSTCLTPGSALTFNFVNVTAQNPTNVTNVTITYQRYVTSTAYTQNLLAGTTTPTATGYYYTTYTHGTAGTGNAVVILNLVPLMIGVVILLLVITSATWLQGF